MRTKNDFSCSCHHNDHHHNYHQYHYDYKYHYDKYHNKYYNNHNHYKHEHYKYLNHYEHEYNKYHHFYEYKYHHHHRLHRGPGVRPRAVSLPASRRGRRGQPGRKRDVSISEANPSDFVENKGQNTTIFPKKVSIPCKPK